MQRARTRHSLEHEAAPEARHIHRDSIGRAQAKGSRARAMRNYEGLAKPFVISRKLPVCEEECTHGPRAIWGISTRLHPLARPLLLRRRDRPVPLL